MLYYQKEAKDILDRHLAENENLTPDRVLGMLRIAVQMGYLTGYAAAQNEH